MYIVVYANSWWKQDGLVNVWLCWCGYSQIGHMILAFKQASLTYLHTNLAAPYVLQSCISLDPANSLNDPLLITIPVPYMAFVHAGPMMPSIIAFWMVKGDCLTSSLLVENLVESSPLVNLVESNPLVIKRMKYKQRKIFLSSELLGLGEILVQRLDFCLEAFLFSVPTVVITISE